MDKKSIFKMIWRGWFVGATIILTPMILLALIITPQLPMGAFLAVLLVPIVAAFQGVIFGGIVVLGLSLWPIKYSES